MRTLLNKSFVLFMLLIIGACSKVSPTPPSTNMPGTLIPATATPTNQPSDTPAPYPYPIPSQPNNPTPSLLPSLSPFPSPLPSPTISHIVQVGSSFRITQLRMFDVNSGWAMYSDFSTGDTKILRTSNGIKSWENVSPSLPQGNSHLAVFFVDVNTAIVVFIQSLMPQSAAPEVTGWRTTDGGQTWQSGESLRLNEGVDIYQVTMIDPERGWMVGEGDRSMGASSVALFETKDGAMHWQMVYDTAGHIGTPDELWVIGFNLSDEYFSFASPTAVFFADVALYLSQDGGKSWSIQSLNPSADLPEINCKSDVNECKYISSISAPQFTSSQDGTLLRRVYLSSEISFPLLDRFHLPLPIAQYLYYTHDGGQTWVSQPSPAKIGTIYFLNAQTGWLLGKSDPDPSTPTQFYQTTDGGKTWTEISSNNLLPLGSDLQFVNEETGFAFEPSAVSSYYQDYDSRVSAGISPGIFYTDDGGRSWVKVEPQLTP